MEFNKDIETRDKIIYGRYREKKYKYGGTLHYEGLTVGTMKELMDQKFLDPEERQNSSPTVQEIYDFMCTYPGYTAHGYTVSADRDDYRVSVEGVMKPEQAATPEECQAFLRLFENADELRVEGYMYCWFD